MANDLPEPKSRKESYLAKAAGMDVTVPEAPESREEQYLAAIAEGGGGGGTSDYTNLTNKPQINSVTLSGNKTSSDLGVQDTLVSGTNIKTINGASILGSGNLIVEGGGGGGGDSGYSDPIYETAEFTTRTITRGYPKNEIDTIYGNSNIGYDSATSTWKDEHLTFSKFISGSSEINIPVSTYFPTGMKSVTDKNGIVYRDELTTSKAVARIGVIDLGDITWAKDSTHSPSQGFQAAGSNTTAYNIFRARFKKDSGTYTTSFAFSDRYSGQTTDMGCYYVNLSSMNRLYIYDSERVDLTAAEFKAAVTGIKMYYIVADTSLPDVTTNISPELSWVFESVADTTESVTPTPTVDAVIKFSHYMKLTDLIGDVNDLDVDANNLVDGINIVHGEATTNKSAIDVLTDLREKKKTHGFMSNFKALKDTKIKAKTALPYNSNGYTTATLWHKGSNLAPILQRTVTGTSAYTMQLDKLPKGNYRLSFDYTYGSNATKGKYLYYTSSDSSNARTLAISLNGGLSGHYDMFLTTGSYLRKIVIYSDDAATSTRTCTWTNINLSYDGPLNNPVKAPQSQSYTYASFGDGVTIYGGEIEWDTGKVTSLYAADGTLLAEPVVYNLEPKNIIAYEGVNNLYCNDAETECEYYAGKDDEYCCDINFWGDSLTFSGRDITYPMACANALGGVTYMNNGVGGEDSFEIGARQGGWTARVPAGPINGQYTLDGEGTSIVDDYGHHLTFLRQGGGYHCTVNPIEIGGKSAWIAISQTGPTDPNATYTISGYHGDASTIPMGIKFNGSKMKSKITCIWVGTNNNPFDTDELIGNIKSMMQSAESPCIILGLSTGNASTRPEYEQKMYDTFGGLFFNTREMMVKYGMTLEGLTPTATDETQMASGMIPDSLRGEGDNTHFNSYGYDALGKMIADKIRSLGYDSLLN